MNIVSKQVQEANLDLGAAFNLVNALRDELLSMRGKTINYEDKSRELRYSYGIEVKETGRIRKTPMNRVYNDILNKLIMELNERFSDDSKGIMKGISALTLSSSNFLNYDFLSLFEKRFCISFTDMKHEISLMKKIVNESETLTESLIELCPYKKAFEGIYRLLLLAVTLPVTSA